MLKCIVADDSKIVRGVIVKILTNLGFDVLETDNGDEAFELYEREHENLSLIVIDNKLSGFTGLNILYKIRTSKKKYAETVPIIISSSSLEEEKIVEALTLGASDYLMKPFDGDILKSKLEVLDII